MRSVGKIGSLRELIWTLDSGPAPQCRFYRHIFHHLFNHGLSCNNTRVAFNRVINWLARHGEGTPIHTTYEVTLGGYLTLLRTAVGHHIIIGHPIDTRPPHNGWVRGKTFPESIVAVFGDIDKAVGTTLDFTENTGSARTKVFNLQRTANDESFGITDTDPVTDLR